MRFSLLLQIIVTVNLDNNKIGATGVKYLADMLKNNRANVISTLTLSYNCIDDIGAKYLIDAIENNLVYLIMSK